MIKIWVLMVSVISTTCVIAADMYGLSDKDTKKIMKKYEKDIAEFEMAFQKEIASNPRADASNERESKAKHDLGKKRLDLIDKIKNENGFLFVDFQTIFYPTNKGNDNAFYNTIEVVDKNHPERLRFLNRIPISVNNVAKKRVHKPDVLEAMIDYNNTTTEIVYKNTKGSLSSSCPVYHCTVGFEHPKLKPYLKIFNQGVIKDKVLILQTLNHDSDPKRRAAAAYLIGHFQNPHEIISILSGHVADKDEGVRNDVMRVIGATMAKAKISDIDVMPFIDALDSPYTTDRNKALYVLLNAAESKESKRLILQKGGKNLLALTRLQQPNNHDWAYLILKKISGKDFGSTNLVSWTRWVSSAQQHEPFSKIA